MATEVDPHRVFVDAWRAFGELWLFDEDGIPGGSEEAYFRLARWNGGRWWSDERLPPQMAARPKFKAKAEDTLRRLVSAPPIFPTIPGRFAEMMGWPWETSEKLMWWERWHADPKAFGLEPEPLLWWEAEEWEDDWPLAV